MKISSSLSTAATESSIESVCKEKLFHNHSPYTKKAFFVIPTKAEMVCKNKRLLRRGVFCFLATHLKNGPSEENDFSRLFCVQKVRKIIFFWQHSTKRGTHHRSHFENVFNEPLLLTLDSATPLTPKRKSSKTKMPDWFANREYQ